jgi:hypothetical protein
MPLAMFVGSNHELQNIVFGQVLLRDEIAESFAWLFTTFKMCMHGHEPHVLLTGEFVVMKSKWNIYLWNGLELGGSVADIC